MERTSNFLRIAAVVTSDTAAFPAKTIWFRIPAAHAALGTALMADLRGKMQPVTVAAMPFHPTTYKR